MNVKQFNNKYIIRIDKGEEIISSLKTVCKKHNIRLGSLTGIGAVNSVEIGLFDTHSKKYYSNTYNGDFEICSLTGNVSTMEGKEYLHFHIVVADIDNKTMGGHLNKAIVSATCEIIIDAIKGEIDRQFSEEIGLNLIID